MRARLPAILVSAFLVICLILVGQKALVAIGTGQPIAIVIGIALVVLLLAGVWALWRELRFGSASSRLGRLLEERGLVPEDEVPVRPSGRPERAAVDELFPAYRAAVEAEPESWTAWFRLGIVYDGAGDRIRARQAIREAIRLERAAR
ncbi:tetratricopeptide repeat protein [Mycetocola saprophilus]|uniref:tetratricopeptide repeat protein n=1 Tax=Mycetocola saprophilus TaxID=76636 RepID=UPI0004C248BD|nr:tetratricopeptide repeat protein [Mycetocola saprophilus]